MSRSPASRRTPRLRLETLEDRTTPSTAYALTDNNILFRFDTAKPVQVQSAVAVTGLAAGDTLLGIDFRPATPAHVTLALFDLAGRRVRTMLDEDRPAGRHTEWLDAAGIPPGVYLVRLRAGGRTLQRRIVRMR